MANVDVHLLATGSWQFHSRQVSCRPETHIYIEGKPTLTLHLTAILPEWLRGRTRNALAKAAKVRILRIAEFFWSRLY